MKRLYLIMIAIGIFVSSWVPVEKHDKAEPLTEPEPPGSVGKSEPEPIDQKPRTAWAGNYAAALQAAEIKRVLLVVHDEDLAPIPNNYHLDLRSFQDDEFRRKAERYFPGPYPSVHVLLRHRGRVKSARNCGPRG